MAAEAAGAPRWQLRVEAGPRARIQTPLVAPAPPGVAEGCYRLATDGGAPATAQISEDRLFAVLPHVPAGQGRRYRLEALPGGPAPAGVAVSRDGSVLGVELFGAAFTALRLEGAPKPFLHPLRAPGGTSVVRGWPVDPAGGERADHPHHRGVWVGHGDVNGMDAWEEHPARLGRIVADAVEHSGGPVCGGIRLRLRWLAPDGRAVAAEERTYRFWAADGQARCFDQESVYQGVGAGPVRFGDTKEGALCGLRVAGGMEGQAGGRICTAEGARGEGEAWGSAAGWCDYSGEPARPGAGPAPTVGVAIFDHPGNPLHPTRWHVRDYGLMAANPFALSHYLPGRGLRGDWEIAAGAAAAFRFRVCVHRDGAAGAEVARRYADFAFPPRAAWERSEA